MNKKRKLDISTESSHGNEETSSVIMTRAECPARENKQRQNEEGNTKGYSEEFLEYLREALGGKGTRQQDQQTEEQQSADKDEQEQMEEKQDDHVYMYLCHVWKLC